MIDHLFHFLSTILTGTVLIEFWCSWKNLQKKHVWLLSGGWKWRQIASDPCLTSQKSYSISLVINQIHILKGFAVVYNLNSCTCTYTVLKMIFKLSDSLKN